MSAAIEDRIIRLPEVKHITGLSRSMIYKMEGQKKFPRGIRMGERFTGWLLSEVNNWLAERRNDRDKGQR